MHATLRSWLKIRLCRNTLCGPGAGLLGVAVAVACLLAGCAAGPQEAWAALTTPSGEVEMEAAVFAAINITRLDKGLKPLQRDAALDRVARLHTSDMARLGKISHRGSDGKTVEGRAARADIDWQMLGENVARNRGYADPCAKAVLHWMASAGHRANILNADFTRTGMGVVRGPDGYLYFTQVFLLPMP